MGSAASALMGRQAITGGIPAGTVFHVTSCDGDNQFQVKLTSSKIIANGGSASLLKGKATFPDGDTMVVAIKVFRWSLDEQQHLIYRKELDAAQKIGQPSRFILPYLGTATLRFQDVLVSPFMQNGNLLNYIERLRPLKANQQVLVIQTAIAVDHLHHTLRLIHGDIKCENVLVDDNGHVCLADFGLSTLIDKAEAGTTTATAMRGAGTGRFAAPELLLDSVVEASGRKRSKSMQTDVYAFGMLILQLMTGQPPWPELSTTGIMMKFMASTSTLHPRPGSEVTHRGLTDAWWDACVRCWSYEPEKRPTIRAVLDELRRNQLDEGTELRGHTDRISAVVFLAGGSCFVTCSDDHTIRIWDMETEMTVIGPLRSHGDKVSGVAVSPNGDTFASCSEDGTIQLWDAASGTPRGDRIKGHVSDTGALYAIAYSPDGDQLVTGSDYEDICIWDAATLRAISQPHEGPGRWALCIAVSPDGRTIASGCNKGMICIWNARSGQRKFTFVGGHSEHVNSLAFLPDGKRLVSCGQDETVRIWNVARRQEERILRGHFFPVTSVAVSPSGQHIVSGAGNGGIILWLTATGVPSRSMLLGHSRSVSALAFSPDGGKIVSGSLDRTVRIWNVFD